MSGVQIRLSGQVAVTRDGVAMALPGQRTRALLVHLAMEAGRRVSSDELVERVWGDAPPANPRASLHTNIARLRQVLGPDRVVTHAEGYLLEVPREDVDLLAFQDLLDRARPGRADEYDLLVAGLDLWRGPPFAGVSSDWVDQQLVTPWVERYLTAYERLVDLDLEGGVVGPHVPRLRDLVERHPLRETLWARLLSALQRDGRTAEALEHFDALRRRLADELGVDPSTALQRLHAGLLQTEPVDVARPAATAVPHLLPADIEGFTGRHGEVAELEAAVDDGIRTVALHGPGGVGKTSLAIRWARQVCERFPDGELFVDLRGYGPRRPMSSSEALDQLLRGLGVAGAEIPDEADARAALLRSRMSQTRALLLLDNARSAHQVRPLLPGGDNVVVVTSRSQLRSLVSREGARRVHVAPMPPADAIALLRKRIGSAEEADSEQLSELADLCGRLPVALAVAAERAGRDGEARLGGVLDRLRDDRARITALTDWDDDPLTGVREVFAWSYEVLDTDTSRLFQLLGLMPDSMVSIGAAAALAGIEPAAAERLLDRLSDAHLVQELAPGWYLLHDLARAYAGEVAAEVRQAERDEAVRRLRGWFVHSCRGAGSTIRPPTLEPTLTDPPVGVLPAVFGAGEDATERAMSWFHDHQRSIRAVFEAAVEDGDHSVVVALALAEGTYLRDTVVALAEAGQMARIAYRSAEELGDPVTVAICATRLGLWAAESGDHDGALTNLTRARDLFTATGHQVGRLTAETNICALLARLDQLGEAMEQLRRVLEEETFSPEAAYIRVRMENNLADGYLQLGRWEDALETATVAVEHARQAPGMEADLATVLITLGEIYQAGSAWSHSVEVLEEARTFCHRGGSRRYEIIVLKLLGLAHRELGEPDAARRCWEQAADLLAGSDVLRAYGVSSEDLHELIAGLPDGL